MNKKLFVGGIDWHMNDDALRQAFERFGEVENAKVIFDKITGRSRGFGFVTFSKSESAETALSQMDGTDLQGKKIRVNHAQERDPAQPRENQERSFQRSGQDDRGYGNKSYSNFKKAY